ncbi:hypothetical protein GJU40_10645 [Bacillus lacus]|uniref:EF-hand domain-containing protein n=1 Tax=Metabacillus lacus TaxID=1983721 RepID=A0A7X2LXI4_9BACI|nr:TasA family protein [Metabacillus lacus]MRX72605.1 hypothetical protein [Metabacillus lacus]
MSVKKKVVMGMSSIALGALAVMGGTFAYFSDSVSADSHFTNGTLVLKPKKPYLENFSIDNWKPGDKLVAEKDNQDPSMVLNNQGTLPMNVFMKVTSHSEKDTHKHIVVNSLKFGGEDILGKITDINSDGKISLDELDEFTKKAAPATVNGNSISDVGAFIGFLPAKDNTNLGIKAVTYSLEFLDNGKEQNYLQGDKTKIGFQFTGLQTDGVTLDKDSLDNGQQGGGGTYKRTDDINKQK